MIEKEHLQRLLKEYATKVLKDDLSWPEMQVCHEIMLEAANVIGQGTKND